MPPKRNKPTPMMSDKETLEGNNLYIYSDEETKTTFSAKFPHKKKKHKSSQAEEIESFDEDAPTRKSKKSSKEEVEDEIMDDLDDQDKASVAKPDKKKTSTRTGKSAGRNYLKSFYGGNVFRKGVQPSPEDIAPQVAYEDTAQFFQSFRLCPPKGQSMEAIDKAEKVKTPFDLIVNLKRSAEYNLSLSRYKVYVTKIDKGEYTPSTKGQEQLKRLLGGAKKRKTKDKKKKTKKGKEEESSSSSSEEEKVEDPNAGRKYSTKAVSEDGIPHRLRFPYVDPAGLFPWDWDDAMDDRKGTRRRIIADIVSQWLDVYLQDPCHEKLREIPGVDSSKLVMRVPPGKRWIITGHCLTLDHLARLDIGNVGKDLTDDDVYQSPILVEGLPNGTQHMTLEYRWRDKIGEADFGFFSFQERILRESEPIEQQPFQSGMDIFSTDTDIGYYALAYMRKKEQFCGELPQIAINISSQYWIHSYKRPNVGYQEWMYINALYSVILSKGEHSKLKEPIWSFLAAAFNGGGDFVDPYYGLPAYHWINAIYHHGDHIGDLVHIKAKGGQLDVEIDGEAYVKLLKTAYILSKPQRFNSTKMSVGTLADWLCTKDEDNPLSLPKVTKLMEPHRFSFSDVKESTSTLGVKNRFPSTDVIMAKAAQLLYYMKLVIQIGSPTLVLPDALEYGYVLVPVKMELPSKANVPDNERQKRQVEMSVHIRRHGAMEPLYQRYIRCEDE